MQWGKVNRVDADSVSSLIEPEKAVVMMASGTTGILAGISIAKLQQRANGVIVDWEHVREKLRKRATAEVSGIIGRACADACISLTPVQLKSLVGLLDNFETDEADSLAQLVLKASQSPAAAHVLLRDLDRYAGLLSEQFVANIQSESGTEITAEGDSEQTTTAGIVINMTEAEVVSDQISSILVCVALRQLDGPLCPLLGAEAGTVIRLALDLDPQRHLAPLLRGDLSVLSGGVGFGRHVAATGHDADTIVAATVEPRGGGVITDETSQDVPPEAGCVPSWHCSQSSCRDQTDLVDDDTGFWRQGGRFGRPLPRTPPPRNFSRNFSRLCSVCQVETPTESTSFGDVPHGMQEVSLVVRQRLAVVVAHAVFELRAAHEHKRLHPTGEKMRRDPFERRP